MTNPEEVNPDPVPQVIISTRAGADGTYQVVLTVGELERVMTGEELVAHAVAVMGVVAGVRHDTALLRQLTEGLGMPWDQATAMVGALDREPVDEDALHPLHLQGMVSRSGEGYLILVVHGHRVGELPLVQAVHHAAQCLALRWSAPMEQTLLDRVSEMDGYGDLSRTAALVLLEKMKEFQVPLVEVSAGE